MLRDEYLRLLREKLTDRKVPGADQMVSYYAEMIDDRMEDGLTEEEAVASMEKIDAIVEHAKLEQPITALMTVKAKESREKAESKGHGGLWTALVVIGSPVWLALLIAFFAVVLALFIVLWAVVISLFAIDGALAIAAVGCVVLTLSVVLGWIPAGTAVAAAGCALILAGLAILLWKPVVGLAKAVMRVIGFTARKVKGIFAR